MQNHFEILTWKENLKRVEQAEENLWRLFKVIFKNGFLDWKSMEKKRFIISFMLLTALETYVLLLGNSNM